MFPKTCLWKVKYSSSFSASSGMQSYTNHHPDQSGYFIAGEDIKSLRKAMQDTCGAGGRIENIDEATYLGEISLPKNSNY